MQKLTNQQRLLAEKLVRERQSRERLQGALNVEGLLFGPQKACVDDTERFVAVCCSRRAGKTYGLGIKLLREGMKHPHALVLYVTRAREMAKTILHPVLRQIARDTGIELEFKENTGDVVLPNGTRILLRGCDTEREMGKLRGMKYVCAVIDEAQEFGSLLTKLVNEVIEPATSDYMGQIYMTGTPNAACIGPYFEAMHDTGDMRGWSRHSWTILDNPHHPGKEEYLAEIRAKRNWTLNHPSYMREYLGRWVRDSNSMVFPGFHPSRNVNTEPVELPEGEEWSYVLGCDIGYNDPTAYVVLAYNQVLGSLYVVESYEDSRGDTEPDAETKLGVTPSRFCAEVQQLNDQYDFEAIVIDTGGIGKGYAEELREKYGIQFIPADKQKRLAFLKLLDGDFRTGIVQVNEGNSQLITDLQLMQWDVDKAAKGRWVFDAKSDKNDHLVDALLYGWRYCFHQHIDWHREGPRKGTPEYEDALMEAYWERRGAKMRQEQEDPDNLSGRLPYPG